ncbi:MAG: phosphatidate cytidylyltransferase [Candidatus Omnitrophica bacterium]|nr:phosphatidate cytidylyltransferase [Candidatus Omnitrophota bacterium]
MISHNIDRKTISKRIKSSIYLIIFTILAIIFRPIFLVVSLFLILESLWEFFGMIEKKGARLFKPFGLVLGAIIPVSIAVSFPLTAEWQFMIILVSLFLLFLFELTKKKNQEVVLSIAATLFGVMYISWCFSFTIRIRNLPQGVYLLSFLVLVVKAQDIGAYLIGNAFGRRALLKRVSPHKSVEGAIGGVASAVISALIFSRLLPSLSLGHALILGFVLSIIGQLGDLFESLIKRDCGVKDSGKIIAGMGGTLDVIDSLLFASPVFYLYLTMIR